MATTLRVARLGSSEVFLLELDRFLEGSLTGFYGFLGGDLTGSEGEFDRFQRELSLRGPGELPRPPIKDARVTAHAEVSQAHHAIM